MKQVTGRVGVLCAAILLLLSGCVAVPQLSPQQRRTMQVRSFEGTSYENVFRAFRTVLQDEGYIVKNQDMAGGLIVAHASRSERNSAFMVLLADPNTDRRTGQRYEVSVSLEKVSDTHTETRLIVERVDSYSRGGSQGQEVVDPEMYRNIYQKVNIEVERRKAQGR